MRLESHFCEQGQNTQTSSDFPVTNTPCSSFEKDCYKISKVGSLFLIFLLRRKIYLQQIGENFVWRGFLISRLLAANDGSKVQVAIDVFVNSRQAQIDVATLKIYLHFFVTVDAVSGKFLRFRRVFVFLFLWHFFFSFHLATSFTTLLYHNSFFS